MLHLFTFCVDIQKHTITDLYKMLDILIKSLDKHLQNYNLIIYTNFIKEYSHKNIIIKKYYDKSNKNYFKNNWLNLSFNKINIWKDLYDSTNINYTWIDLDTIITYNIEYFNNYNNIFLENGGDKTHLERQFKNFNYCLPYNSCIQGNIWKININLYNIFIKLFDRLNNENKILMYDLQSLFGYYFYHELNGNLTEINILGKTIKQNTITGLCIWNKGGGTHCNLHGLNNLYYDSNILKSHFYENNEIHILSLTFDSIKQIWNQKKFIELFNTE
jgi:hypothetical protein